MNIRERLEALVVNPRLAESGGDLDFAKSLLGSYNARKSLSSGRRVWLDRLEEKYSEANYVDPLDNETGRQLKSLLSEDLGDRDRAFVESLKRGFTRWGNLSEKQQYALQSIAERYSPEGQARLENWSEVYRSEHREEAIIAAHYYLANPPYYGDLSEKILNDESFIPSEKQVRSITKNKYAQKVIAATLAEAKYPVNSLVEGRASSSRSIRGKKAFVLQVNSGPVTSAAKGVKKYLVLPVGEATPVVVEERHIKLVKKIKK